MENLFLPKICTSCLLKGISRVQFSMQIWTRESQAACLAHEGTSWNNCACSHASQRNNMVMKIYFINFQQIVKFILLFIYFYHRISGGANISSRAIEIAWENKPPAVRACVDFWNYVLIRLLGFCWIWVFHRVFNNGVLRNVKKWVEYSSVQMRCGFCQNKLPGLLVYHDFCLHLTRGVLGKILMGVCRWDSETLNLYQTTFMSFLQTYSRLDAKNPYPIPD